MLDTVRHALGRSLRRSRLYECRVCGTAVAHADGPCQDCGSTEVATYEL